MRTKRVQTAGESAADTEGWRRWVELLAEIRRFQARHAMPDTLFGRRAINDPRLIADLRRGRELRAVTAARVRRFMAERA